MAEELVLDILWTQSAKNSFQEIVDYLQTVWTEREVGKFINRAEKMLLTLKHYPEMCRPSAKRRNVRIGIFDKHTQIIYHYKPRKKQICVLLFWNMKQDPSRLKY